MKKILVLCLVCSLASVFSFAEPTALELFESAKDHQNRKQWFEAVDLYREALNINPNYADAWYNLALCSYALGNYELTVEYADKAAKYTKNLTDIQNLKGMALILLGNVTEAKNVFTDVLKRYPRDIYSRFGLAELDLLEGKISVAETRYFDALKQDPQNKKALLSLALISAEMGKNAVSENYINQALSNYSGEAEVHYLAAYLAAGQGNYKVAEQRARSAVQIDTGMDNAYSLLAGILFAQKRYAEVIDICDFRIGRNRNLSTAWYLKGLSLSRLGKNSEAIAAYEKGLSINPQDELMRAALEQLAVSSTTIEDKKRDSWAMYHYDKAKEYGLALNARSERFEFQKALSIAPLNEKIRFDFAQMLNRDGLYELYVQQLNFIKDNTAVLTDSRIKRDENSPKKSSMQIRMEDDLEAFKSLMANNISDRWQVDPFYLDKTRWSIGIYFTKKPIQLFHADMEDVTALAAQQVFNGVTSTAVVVNSVPVTSYAQAFRAARTSGQDYFIIMNASETERTFLIDAEIYSGKTGTKTSGFSVYRTGNDCMARSLQRFRQAVMDILPIRGKVLKNVQGKLLIDLGKNDGVTKDSEFDIIRKGGIVTKDSGVGITYNEKDLLGTVKVVDSNEELSEGLYKKNGFYDTLNAGDEVILTKIGEKKDLKVDGNAASDSRPQADSLGVPVTPAAQKDEKEALRESLKTKGRESTLINLIRGIF